MKKDILYNRLGYEVRSPEVLLAEAYKIASEAFVDIFDRQGQPYIKHCLFVAQSVSIYGMREETVGVLHDLFEDTEYRSTDLLRLGFSDEIVDAVHLLTFPKGIDKEFYINRVKGFSNNKLARRVKIADLTHNLHVDRLKGVGPKDMERINKYLISIQILKKKEDDHNKK